MVLMASGIGDGDDRVAQDGDHTSNSRFTETCSLFLLRTSLILDIHVMINIIDTYQNKVSTDQHHMII